MAIPAKTNGTSADAVEAVIAQGDLSKLTAEGRVQYYQRVCHSLGLNPLTRPFDYILLNGKLTLYAKRDAADQLRKINGISIEIVSQDVADGMLTVHVRATDTHGRKDEDLGVVAFPEHLKGEARANTILKAVTKAKRRVTLSISGLGFLDETEVADIPAASKAERLGTTAQDVIGEPIEYDDDGNPIDNIPRGDPGIERLSKAMGRPEYANLCADIRNIKDLDNLFKWGMDNANRVESLPLDWQEILRGEFRERMIALGWKKSDR